MSSEDLAVTSARDKLTIRRYEMALDTEEVKHISNLYVHEVRLIENRRILYKERKQERKDEQRRIQKEHWKREKENKRIEKENKKKEKKNKKLEREREKEMRKTGDKKSRTSFCWLF
ncbi:hypothetical protein ACLOAV_004211 [Pseudogymnoascus australis]